MRNCPQHSCDVWTFFYCQDVSQLNCDSVCKGLLYAAPIDSLIQDRLDSGLVNLLPTKPYYCMFYLYRVDVHIKV